MGALVAYGNAVFFEAMYTFMGVIGFKACLMEVIVLLSNTIYEIYS